jgi:hypothetical protein
MNMGFEVEVAGASVDVVQDVWLKCKLISLVGILEE